MGKSNSNGPCNFNTGIRTIKDKKNAKSSFAMAIEGLILNIVHMRHRLYKGQNISLLIAKCICNEKTSVATGRADYENSSKGQNIFLQIAKCICLNCKMYLSCKVISCNVRGGWDYKNSSHETPKAAVLQTFQRKTVELDIPPKSVFFALQIKCLGLGQ